MAKKTEELFVTVSSSVGKSYDGLASAIAGFNRLGPFSILPRHENFISLITQEVTIYDLSGKKYEIPFEHGILEVSNDRVNVFVGA